jgi:uncharacterized OB-fold protein
MASETSTYLPSGLPAPAAAPGGLEEPFWEATRRHELIVQQCNDCKTFNFAPEWICHSCHSFDMGWAQVSGKGRIYSWERSHYPVHPALASATPYLVVLVELPEAGNVRMVGNLLGDATQDVVVGSEVEAVFEDHPGDDPYTLVQWRVV